MGRFGKKHVIDLNPLSYSICLAGLGGIGKTTLAKEVCEKLVGEEGYIHLNIGRESGVDSINNIITEDVPDYFTFTEIVDDIIENKESDYPDLKVLILDSLDELLRLGEIETIRIHNKTAEKKATSILQCMGGFGKGQDYCINMILDRIFELKAVGVQSFIIAHTKRSDLIDAVTQETYSQLTADAQQRYFNAIKNKMDIVAVGYIDRQISKEKTGRKNVATKDDITINKVVDETRIISFRDDSYSIDSKSRFADIVDKVPFDSDSFIKAIQDAIDSENKRGNISDREAKKIQAEKDKVNAEIYAENSRVAKENNINLEENERLADLIREKNSEASKETKAAMREFMKENGIPNLKDVTVIPTKLLEISRSY